MNPLQPLADIYDRREPSAHTFVAAKIRLRVEVGHFARQVWRHHPLTRFLRWLLSDKTCQHPADGLRCRESNRYIGRFHMPTPQQAEAMRRLLLRYPNDRPVQPIFGPNGERLR